MRGLWIGVLAVVLVMGLGFRVQAGEKKVRMPTEQELKKIQDGAPEEAPAKPAAPRKVLVWGHLWTHDPNAFAAAMMEAVGRKTGAFEAVTSDDPDMLLPEKLKDFDALMMNNIHEQTPFLPANFKGLPAQDQAAAKAKEKAIQDSIVAFVAGGKGLIGVHATTAACQPWPEYGEMIGGYYGGHIGGKVTVKLDDPDSPINAVFEGKGFQTNDEIYIFRDPYSRKKLRVLLSLDVDAMPDPGKRPDKDYAVSWIRDYGKGRVFYCSLGHVSNFYWNTYLLKHFLAGVQFALGDLKADATPK